MALSLALLGTPVITVDEIPLEVDTRKAIALLAYLAMEGGSHPRDRVVDLLWPDSDVDRARSSLRRTLSALRSGLGGRWVTADRNVVTLDPDGVEIDLVMLRESAAPHLAHEAEVCSRCVPDLTRAADMARGEFLDGFYLRDAAPFENWVTTRAEESRRILGAILGQLAAIRAGDGAYPDAIHAIRRRLEFDPLHEEAHRDLMLYLAWSGDRPGAVDAYRKLVAVLDVELGVAPLHATTALYESVLEDDIPPAPAPPRPPVAVIDRTTPMQPPLVGRDDELGRALTALTEPGGIVVASGSAGSGLTRFLDEISVRLRESGATVLQATGSASATGVSYGVIHEALFGALADPETVERLTTLPTRVLSEASRLFPGLTPGIPPPAEASSRTGLLDALSRVVGVLEQPVLVIDDAHACDTASAEALTFLAGTARHTGLGIVLAAPTDEESVGAEVDAMVREMSRRGADITLRPLDEDSVAALVEWFGVDLDPAAVAERSGGLTLYAVEMLRSASRGSETEVPDQIRRAVADRVSRLEGASRQILEALAILDRPSDGPLLAAVSGRSADETDAALDSLITAGFAHESADGTVRIAHSYLAAAVLATATSARRRMLNRRAAAATSMRHPAPGLASRIARHHSLSGDDAAAAHWFVTAGEEAANVFAHRDAILHFEAALAREYVDRAGLHRAIAHSAMLEGRYDQALTSLEAALAAGDPDPARAEHLLGEIHRRLRRWDVAAAHYDRATQQTVDPVFQSVISADRAYIEHHRSGLESAWPWVERALELATTTGDFAALARAHNVAGLVSEDPSIGRTHLEQALEYATEPAERVAVLNNLAAVATPADGVGFIREAIGVAANLGDRHLAAALHNNLADALYRTSDHEGAQAALSKAVELFAEITVGDDEEWVPEVWFLTTW